MTDYTLPMWMVLALFALVAVIWVGWDTRPRGGK